MVASWTTQKTWLAGETVEADEMNTYLRDDSEYLKALVDAQSAAGVRATRVTNQNIPDTTVTLVSWTGETFDIGGWFAPTSTDIIVPVAAMVSGYTHIIVQLGVALYWAGDASGTRRVFFQKNGDEFATHYLTPPSSASMGMVVSPPVENAVAGDVFTVAVQQTSGGSLALVGASGMSLSCTRVGFY